MGFRRPGVRGAVAMGSAAAVVAGVAVASTMTGSPSGAARTASAGADGTATAADGAGADTTAADAASVGRAGDVLRAGVTKVRSDNGLPGVIGMVRDGGATRYAAAGWGDQFRHVPADPRAQFRIGSNTKAFTATVILQLEARHRLSLDDKVAKYLPGVLARNGYDGRKITIRQLLNHTSGLQDYAGDVRVSGPYVADVDPNQRWAPRTLVDIATDKKPVAAPGKTWHYSNANYVLAGMIIQRVTGRAPAVEVRDRIIKPLGLRHTTYPTSDPKLYGNWLHGYTLPRDISFSNVQVFGAAGAIVSTQEDLANFSRALLTGRLLKPKQQRELETTVPVAKPANGVGYGLGVIKAKTKCGPVLTHNGAVLGYLSFWYSSPDGKRQVTVATNEYHLLPTKATESLGNAAIDAYCAIGRK
ncbi:beta-lactamase family protein [Actinomadura barringtoniae]|uniref:Beta-lactamase family protein n=1 Tax=Actinomadura barringtoniae TaxID=1427535 RepID=A0A939PCU0_9ACTN|nr:serine hydrolase domain-containing protein [Actinomadura barringtoniae]MBO2446116.1 beta-lactamase family protein [Actinomadura barringtoniae]